LLENYWKNNSDKMVFRNGLVFRIRPNTNDCYVLTEIVSTSIYTPAGFEIKKKDVVFDVGAHIGSFTLLAAEAAKEGGVYAFEPHPDNYRLLEENISLNNITNVFSEQKAVWSKEKELTIHLTKFKTNNSAYKREGLEGGEITVESKTIEDVMREHNIERINFLKLDCEGSEFEIIKSLKAGTLERIDKLVFEFHEKIAKQSVE